MDRADGPEHPGSLIVIIETKVADWKLVAMPATDMASSREPDAVMDEKTRRKLPRPVDVSGLILLISLTQPGTFPVRNS